MSAVPMERAPAPVVAIRPPRPIRIVFYDHCARMSGAEISMLNTIGALPSADAWVVLGEHGPLVEALDEIGVPCDVLPVPITTSEFSRKGIGVNAAAAAQPIAVLRYAARLAATLNALKPDVIVSNSMKSHVILAAAGPRLTAPVVFHLHDRVSTDFMSVGGVRLEQVVLRTTGRGVIANSVATMATVPRSRRHRVRQIAGGPIAPLPGGYARASSAGPARRFGIVGRLTPWKGQDLAIRAFASAFPRGEETLEVVGGALFGEAAFESQLRSLAGDLGIGDRVLFSGHVDDVYERMAGWEVLIHASTIPEPFGLVVAQGMLCGLPVIAVDEGGPAEMIEHARTGYLVPMGDEAALTARLITVRDDPDGRTLVGAAAALEAERWLAPRIAQQIEDALRVVAGVPAAG